MSLQLTAIVIDSVDPSPLADFWAATLGWRRTDEDEEGVALAPARDTGTGAGPAQLLILKVPESKAGKNRLHLDLRPDDQAAEVARIEALGATRVGVGQLPEHTWVVLADPEGNEFCVLRALRADERDEPGAQA